MLHKEKNAGKRAADNSSLSKKIISKMAVITAGIFLLTILMSAFLAARSLIQVNREKLAAAAYENSFLVETLKTLTEKSSDLPDLCEIFLH